MPTKEADWAWQGVKYLLGVEANTKPLLSPFKLCLCYWDLGIGWESKLGKEA